MRNVKKNFFILVCKTPPFQRDLKCVEGILHGVKRQAEDSGFRQWLPLLGHLVTSALTGSSPLGDTG